MAGVDVCYTSGTQWKSAIDGRVYTVGQTGGSSGGGGGGGGGTGSDWSTSNLPWAYTDTSAFTANWPSGVTVVDIQTGSSDFYTNLTNTINAAGKRVVVRLGTGTYHLNQFRMIGTSGNPNYAFGFWHTNLRGFLGQGPDKTVIQMDPNSMTQAQLNGISAMTASSFQPLQQGFMRIDGSSTSPVLIAGVTFRGTDQQLIQSFASDVPANVPQPAPYNGLFIFPNSKATVSYTRFQANARACYSAPPFEMGLANSQYGTLTFDHCEFDGRLAPEVDSSQPRRAAIYLANNETSATFSDCWFHHSNVSKMSINDQNRDTSGTYTFTRCKWGNIANNQNTDPVYGPLRGYTNCALSGFESCNGTVTFNDCIMSVDDPYTDGGQKQRHISLTSVGSRNPSGGRLYVNGGTFHNTGFPGLEGYLTMWVDDPTYWWINGVANTIDVRDSNNVRLTAYDISGLAWPPTASQLSAAGVSPTTHYLVRTS